MFVIKIFKHPPFFLSDISLRLNCQKIRVNMKHLSNKKDKDTINNSGKVTEGIMSPKESLRMKIQKMKQKLPDDLSPNLVLKKKEAYNSSDYSVENSDTELMTKVNTKSSLFPGKDKTSPFNNVSSIKSTKFTPETPLIKPTPSQVMEYKKRSQDKTSNVYSAPREPVSPKIPGTGGKEKYKQIKNNGNNLNIFIATLFILAVIFLILNLF